MKIIDAVVWWFPKGDVGVVSGDTVGKGSIPKGAWWMPAVPGFKPRKRKLSVFLLFNTMVVRDGVDAQVAHDAFLKIDEYRKTIPHDQRGAE